MRSLRKRRAVRSAGWQRWVRAHGWKVGLGVVALVIVGQLLYPSDRTLPFARVAGEPFGMQSRQAVETMFKDTFSSLRSEVKVDNQAVTRLAVKDIGATLDVAKSSEPVFEYSWWQRLVPFSFLAIHPQANDLEVTFDDAKLTKALEERRDILQAKPRQATIVIEDDKARIQPEKAGAIVEIASLERAVKKAQYAADREIVLEPRGTTEAPTRTKSDKSVQAVYRAAKTALKKPLTLQYGEGESATVEPTVFGTWLTVREQEDSTLTLGYDEAKITEHLNTAYGEKVNKPAGVTKVQTLDGVETGRTPGAIGLAIDGGGSAAAIGEGVLGKGEHSATIAMKEVPPREEFNRQYTSTPRGVAAYTHDISESGDIAISLVSPQVTAGGKAGQSMTAASTYKLFVAVMVLHKIDAGDIKNDESIAGATVSACLDKMIVQSDNPCAEALVEKLKRRDINEFFYSRGYSKGTTFTHPETAKATAADLTKLLQDIDAAKDIKPESRERLLGLMRRQQYRQGIPAGSSASVADKVGFLGGVLNDAATVEHPRGKYHLTVLTNGQSWAKIAEITRKIESLMYP